MPGRDGTVDSRGAAQEEARKRRRLGTHGWTGAGPGGNCVFPSCGTKYPSGRKPCL